MAQTEVPAARPQLQPGLLAPRPSLLRRLVRRSRALLRLGGQQMNRYRSAMVFAGALACVGLSIYAPLLLDDLVSRTAYLLPASPDAVTIDGPLVLSEQPLIVLKSGTLSVPPSLTGQARTVEALTQLLKGGTARVAIDNPVIELELVPLSHEDFEPATDTVAPASPLQAALEDASFENLAIRNGTIVLKSSGGRIDRLIEVNADIGVKRKTAVRVKGAASFNGEIVNFDSTFGARIGRRGSARMPVKANIQAGPLKAVLEGRLDVGNGLQLFAGNAALTVSSVRTMARWFGEAWPSGPGLKEFRADGSLEWVGQTIAMPKGVFELDGNQANGALALTVGGARPAVFGTLALQTLSLAPYTVDRSADGLLTQLKQTRDLTLPLIGMVDVDVRLSAEQVSCGTWRSGRAATSIALHDGQMIIDVAELALEGGGIGSGEASITGSPTHPAFAARGRISSVDLASVSTAVVGAPWLRGEGRLDFDLRSSGGAGLDVLSRLNGRIGLKLPTGSLASCAIHDLTAAAAQPDQPSETPICRSQTALAPLDATIPLSNGIITADYALVTTSAEDLRVQGTVDLVTRIIDLKVSGTGAEPHFVKGRPESLAIGLAQPRS